MNVKNKIRLGTIFLFLLLMLMGGVGIYYVASLKADAKEVLKDNYESLSYCHIMLHELNNIQRQEQTSVKEFEGALDRQNANITEPGEQNVSEQVTTYFKRLKSGDTSRQNILALRRKIQNIVALNMKAIEVKNLKAQATANKALTYIIALSGIVFLISFTFVVNFPSVVIGPVRQLSEAIKQVANKNYRHRIQINSKDEFGNLADAFNNMAERLEYFESSNLNKLLFEKSRAEAVINSLKDASIGIDKNNNILFANYQALQLLGLQANEMVGKSVSEVTVKNDLFRFLIDNETSTPVKIVVDNKENYFIKEMVEVAQGDSNNKVIVLKNITSFKELDVAKTNFIATISHELKTPLASSDFSLKLLEDERTGQLSHEQKELVDNLKHDNLRMLKILSELLNMSQVEAGRIQLDIQTVAPAQIISNAIQAVAASAKEKEVLIKDESGRNLPFIKADADKTTWVLNNFLTNAIKYSPAYNSVVVSALLKSGSVVFSVKDHGPGVAKEYQSKLFDRYFQVPGSNSKGTGIGLSISKEFIEAQQGKIWVESEIGQATVFSFQLPVSG